MRLSRGRRSAEHLMAVDSAFAVVPADLDSLQAPQRHAGPRAGDRALKLFADTAIGVVRDRDHVVRWGGENSRCCCRGRNVERGRSRGRLRVTRAQAHLLSGTPVFTASFGISDSTMTRERDADPARRRDGAVSSGSWRDATVAPVGDGAQLIGPAVA
jgi:GGDEF domain-containing protein